MDEDTWYGYGSNEDQLEDEFEGTDYCEGRVAQRVAPNPLFFHIPLSKALGPGKFVHETEKARLYQLDFDKQVTWIPKKLLRNNAKGEYFLWRKFKPTWQEFRLKPHTGWVCDLPEDEPEVDEDGNPVEPTPVVPVCTCAGFDGWTESNQRNACIARLLFEEVRRFHSDLSLHNFDAAVDTHLTLLRAQANAIYAFCCVEVLDEIAELAAGLHASFEFDTQLGMRLVLKLHREEADAVPVASAVAALYAWVSREQELLLGVVKAG